MRRPRLLVIGIVLAWSTSAHAQSERELATRRDMITQAQDLSDQGKHDEALALAKRAGAIKMTPSLRLFLAREESVVGHIADAYGNARQCDAEAEANDRLGARQRILLECKELEESLGKRVGRITVRLPASTPSGVRVTVSGEDVSAALLGEPYVVSPGKVAITVAASGYLPYASEVDVAEGGSAAVDVQLAPDPRAQPCPDGQERVDGDCVVTPSAVVPIVAPPARDSRLGPQRTLGLALGAVGVVGVGIGTALGLMASSAWNDAKSACGGNVAVCNDGGVSSARSSRNTAEGEATASTIGWVGAGAFLAVGATLYFTAGSKNADAAPAMSLVVAPRVAPGQAGLALTGAF